MNSTIEALIITTSYLTYRLRPNSTAIITISAILLLVITPASANLLINSDFENGDYTSYGWHKHGMETQIVTSPSACRGNYSAMFEVKARADGTGGRTELRGINLEFNTEYWIGYAVYVPEGLEKPRGGMQLHGSPDIDEGEWWRNPPLSIWIRDDYWNLVNSWSSQRINHSTGAPGGKTENEGFIERNLGTVVPSKWQEIVLHFKTVYDKSGFMEVWLDGNKVVDLTNIGSVFNDAKGPYLNIGLYVYDFRSSAGDFDPNRTDNYKQLYMDEFRLGDANSSYDDVAPKCVSSSGSPPIPSPPINVNVR